MWFSVFNAAGELIYEGVSWPMARAALDFVVMLDNGCPKLIIRSEEAS